VVKRPRLLIYRCLVKITLQQLAEAQEKDMLGLPLSLPVATHDSNTLCGQLVKYFETGKLDEIRTG
jgi:hypothetical protein